MLRRFLITDDHHVNNCSLADPRGTGASIITNVVLTGSRWPTTCQSYCSPVRRSYHVYERICIDSSYMLPSQTISPVACRPHYLVPVRTCHRVMAKSTSKYFSSPSQASIVLGSWYLHCISRCPEEILTRGRRSPKGRPHTKVYRERKSIYISTK